MDSSLAAESVGSNHDLLIQILLFLPVKSLMCFKSVSTDWLLLIRGARRDVSPTPDPCLGIFMRLKLGNIEEYRYEYIPLNPNHRFSNKSPVLRDFFTRLCPFRGEIILSSNGLLLFYDFDSHRYIVYNPTTLSYTSIPNPNIPNGVDKWTDVGVTMAFDRVTYHYKLIFVLPIRPIYNNYHRNHQSCRIEIYSSETHTWSDSCIIKEVDGGSPKMLQNGVYWNGSVHWIVGSGKILAFHIDTLSLHEVIEPAMCTRYKYEGLSRGYFGESCGHLYYIEEEKNDLIMIYEMKKDYSEWLPKYRFNLAKFYVDYLQVLSLIRFEDDKDSPILLLWVQNKVVKCNLADRKFKTLREFPKDYRLGLSRIIKYVVSEENTYREMRVVVSPGFDTGYGFPFIPLISGT